MRSTDPLSTDSRQQLPPDTESARGHQQQLREFRIRGCLPYDTVHVWIAVDGSGIPKEYQGPLSPANDSRYDLSDSSSME